MNSFSALQKLFNLFACTIFNQRFTSFKRFLFKNYFLKKNLAFRFISFVLIGFLGLNHVASSQTRTALPNTIESALARAKLPQDSVSLLVTEVGASNTPPRLALRTQAAMNPASVTKLLTTYAGLDLLGAGFSWSTPVYVDGTINNGVLTGNLYIQGQGDPKLVQEKLWLLLRRVQGLGIAHIKGNVILDRSAFVNPSLEPSRFDDEPSRPYNAAADALLINYRATISTFVPDISAGVARITHEPPLAGIQTQSTVPLSSAQAACNDWRSSLKANFSNPKQISFAGTYPASCGERLWPQGYVDPVNYNARAIEGLWVEMGGKLTGEVKEGRVPSSLKPTFTMQSPALPEVIRDINKYSNNVMAQQLFLTLSLQKNGQGTAEGSREIMRQWWIDRFGNADLPTIDNGSGLSRQTRISAQALNRLLQVAWNDPVMPELFSSLPLSGIDGTLKRLGKAKEAVIGAAHLKTGTLHDVAAVAGIVHGQSGRRYVLVAIANHANAPAFRPVIETLIDWTVKD